MKPARTCAIAFAIGAMTICSASAQAVPKGPPRNSPARGISGGGSFGGGGINIGPTAPDAPAEKQTVTVTYMALTDLRQWTSADGRSILARMVAFDAGDAEAGRAPVVVKDGAIRLLKDKREYVLPLEKLSAEHRDEALAIAERVRAGAAVRTSAPAAE